MQINAASFFALKSKKLNLVASYMGEDIVDMVTGSLHLNPNLKVINAADYVM